MNKAILGFPDYVKYGNMNDGELANRLLEENKKLQEKINCLDKEILDFKRTIRENNLLKYFKK